MTNPTLPRPPYNTGDLKLKGFKVYEISGSALTEAGQEV